MDDLTGKTAVITGAASGIGLAMAHRFGAAGMKLVLGDIELEPLAEAEKVLRSAGYDVASLELDVRDLAQVTALEELARDRFDRVHVLCNNAGVGGGGPVADPDNIELWRWTIDINLWGVIYGCKVFLPAMLDHGEPGHVVNTASMAGLGSTPFMGAYNVSKYGVVALSETLALEMQIAGTSIGVSALCPAFVQTGIANSQRNLPEALQTDPEDLPPDAAGVGALIEAAVAGGISPDVVADAVVDAVVADDFWVLTHPQHKEGIVGRANEIVTGINPSLRLPPPGPTES